MRQETNINSKYKTPVMIVIVIVIVIVIGMTVTVMTVMMNKNNDNKLEKLFKYNRSERNRVLLRDNKIQVISMIMGILVKNKNELGRH